MSRQSRREFLKRSAAAGAGAALAASAGRVFAVSDEKNKIVGANERIRVAVAGINGRGGSHIDAFARMKNVEVACLVDPDSRIFKQRIAALQGHSGKAPKCVQDLRKALEDKSLNVVSIASCNHWHSLLAIWACQAGKDVYVEKPCSHNVFEGRKLVEAAAKYKCIVQHGTQSRSDGNSIRAVAAAKGGKYGKLLVSKAYVNKPRWTIGFKPIKEPPKELDYNLWLGPAPVQPYHENLVHYNWHWFWDTGNGEIGNQGVHEMDKARWAIPGGTLPQSVISMGGRFVNGREYKDQGQTPNMQLTVFDFGGTLLVLEVRGLVGKGFEPRTDNEFYLEEGVIRKGKFYPKGKEDGEPLGEAGDEQRNKEGDHFTNFMVAVRSRKVEDLHAPIAEGHLSAALCHLANISYRLGKPVPFGQYEALPENSEVRASIKAIEENLKGALKMDLAKQNYCLGAKLEFDAGAEKFLGNDEANKLLTRPYRAPYVVPEEV